LLQREAPIDLKKVSFLFLLEMKMEILEIASDNRQIPDPGHKSHHFDIITQVFIPHRRNKIKDRKRQQCLVVLQAVMVANIMGVTVKTLLKAWTDLHVERGSAFTLFTLFANCHC
jgi:hypothetical protein